MTSTGKESEARTVYADIIDLPHWQSPDRPRMSLQDRAAQFLSYKSLSGFEDLVNEEARLTEEMAGIGDREAEILGRKLRLLAEAVCAGERPTAAFTVFVKDEKKAGGRYEEITDAVRTVDFVSRTVTLCTPEGRGKQWKALSFDSIAAIRGEAARLPDE